MCSELCEFAQAGCHAIERGKTYSTMDLASNCPRAALRGRATQTIISCRSDRIIVLSSIEAFRSSQLRTSCIQGHRPQGWGFVHCAHKQAYLLIRKDRDCNHDYIKLTAQMVKQQCFPACQLSFVRMLPSSTMVIASIVPGNGLTKLRQASSVYQTQVVP